MADNTDPTNYTIPFSTTHTPLPFKLLELPPDLLSLLESANPPTLTLTNTTTTTNAILSTPSKSLKYNIRQKNTSNPIHLLHPTFIKDEGDGEGKEVLGICSIGMIDDTLELYACEVGEGKGKKSGGGGGKVNKWHEKFARGRVGPGGK